MQMNEVFYSGPNVIIQVPNREFQELQVAATFYSHVLEDDCLSFACKTIPASSATFFFLEAICMFR